MTAAADRQRHKRRRAAPSFVLRRPRLEDRLDEAFGKRLTTVVAGAGFGKSTLLTVWADDLEAVWHTVTRPDTAVSTLGRGLASALRSRIPQLARELAEAPATVASSPAEDEAYAETIAGRLCEELSGLEHDLVLILDDVHELDGGPAAHLLATLTRQAPETVHLVLASRGEPPFPVARLRGHGAVNELSAPDLAFSEPEIEELLERSVAHDATALASELHAVTGGWPAAVRMALEALRGVPSSQRGVALERMRRPDAPLFGYLAEEVFGREPAEVRELIRLVSPLPRFKAELCAALGVRAADRTLVDLSRRGLLVRTQQDSDGWLELHGLVRAFAQASWPLEDAELEALCGRTATWLEERGYLREALDAATRAGDPRSLAAFLERRGDELLTTDVKGLIVAAESLPAELRSEALDVVIAEAHHIVGDVQTSLEMLERLAGGRSDLPPRLATWIGIGRWQTGSNDAVDGFRRGRIDRGTTADESLLLSWWARCHLTRGELASARPLAERSLVAARASGDRAALALALHALAFLSHLEGDADAAEAGYVRALEAGEQSQDARARSGTHVNLAGLLLEQGRNREALVHLESAVRLGELHYPFGNIPAGARWSRAAVLAALGRFEEALEDARWAADRLRRWGFALGHPVIVAGEVHRARGALALARAAYEEALAAAERAGRPEALASALGGLARVLAFDEPERARELASRALEAADAPEHATALLDAGWVALAAGDRAAAVSCADRAASESRASRRRPALAEALELQAVVAEDPRVRDDRLREALAVWADLDSPLDIARCELALARFAGDEAAARRAGRVLRAAGIRIESAAGAAGLLASLPEAASPPLAIRTLGDFQVLRDGLPVPRTDWQSKKARDLLKLLVARRGRPTPREALMEALWPGGEPAGLSARFSVALSVLRSVLDPERRLASDAFVRADSESVSLRVEAVAVDVEDFLRTAAAALDRDGGGAELEDAELLYGGDFLEEHAYEDWAVPLREEARALYVAVARKLAAREAAARRYDSAALYLRRLLERDPYDEQAHLRLCSTLAAAGQHGEARRAYGAYVARMAEIGVEAAPYPGVAPFPTSSAGTGDR